MTGNKEQFLVIKPKSLNGNPLPVKSSVIAAARHNLREFDEPNSDIDPSRTKSNRILFGPNTSAAIVALMSDIQMQLGYEPARVNASVAVEIVASLKHDPIGIGMDEYFLGAARWAENWYKGRLISAIRHSDQEYQHCHAIIILDVGKGKPSGTEQIGNLKASHEMAKAFEREYSAQYGVKLPPPPLTGAERKDAARQVIQHMIATGNPMVGAPGWPFVVAAIDKHPERMAPELRLTLVPMSALRRLAQSPGKGPRTKAAEAARDRRPRAATVGPVWTESVSPSPLRDAATPMVVSQSPGAGQSATTMCVAVLPALPAFQLTSAKHSSCVGVPLLKVIPSNSERDGEGLDDASEDEPGTTRERDSEWLAEHYNATTGECRPPLASPTKPSQSTRWASNGGTEEAA